MIELLESAIRNDDSNTQLEMLSELLEQKPASQTSPATLQLLLKILVTLVCGGAKEESTAKVL